MEHLQAIHDKILGLNFTDCHAKIRQVDSHVTVGDGVVVQVSKILKPGLDFEGFYITSACGMLCSCKMMQIYCSSVYAQCTLLCFHTIFKGISHLCNVLIS